MKTKLFHFPAPVTFLVLACAAAPSATAQEKTSNTKLAARANVTRAEAEKIALKAVPGATVKEAELEEERGGLRWSFDLKTPGSKKITEVGVDAITGKVVENKLESAGEEADETAAEKAHGKK